MLFTYSLPQHCELGQDYPCFTNEAAGAGEMKSAFLRATDSQGQRPDVVRGLGWSRTVTSQPCLPLDLATDWGA